LEFKASVIEKEIEHKIEEEQIREDKPEQETEQNKDEDSEIQVNIDDNNNNKRTSLWGIVFNALSFGYFNNTESTITNNKNTSRNIDNNKQKKEKELTSVILNFKFK